MKDAHDLDELKRARLEKVRRETELLESKLAERRRELVPLADVRRNWEAAFVALRNVVLGFGALREADRHQLLEELAGEPLVAAAVAFNESPPAEPDDLDHHDDDDPNLAPPLTG